MPRLSSPWTYGGPIQATTEEIVHHEYTIRAGNQQTQVTGRREAIDQAKELSERTHRPVELTRDDERVHMTYRRGSLLQYRYDTQERARRGAA